MDKLQVCYKCKQSHPERDFLGKDTCYKCQYAQKLSLLKPKKMEKEKSPSREANTFCANCEKEIPQGRWTYCSEKCSKVQKKKRIHWTAQTPSNYSLKEHKKRFWKGNWRI